MKTQIEITEAIAKRFKQSYNAKMGGTQTIVFPNGQSFYFNDKEYYSGRGTKYNSSINHDNKGTIQVSEKELKAYFKILSERYKANKRYAKEQKAAEKRYIANHKLGIYGIDKDGFVELSVDEQYYNTFSAAKIANTLNISIQDADLLNSEGKTYVFAKTTEGKTIMLYHPSLDCNSLSIHISEPAPDFIAEFNNNRSSWVNAPYANEVGQTSNQNHFVC